MAVIESTLSPGSEAFLANCGRMQALIEQVRRYEERTVSSSARSRERFAERGQLLPRERLSLLLDPGTPFLEIASLAGLGIGNDDLDKSVPGGGVIGGIGTVSGARVMINASDSGIDAGALQPMGLPKMLRLQEIALENKLPYVQLVESAGANLLTYKVEEFVTGGSLFRNLARLSAAGLPVLTITHGSSTAGGAYQPRLDDLERRILERFESQMSIFATSARLLDDGVIDPRDTRAMLAQVLAICCEAARRQPRPIQFAVARP